MIDPISALLIDKTLLFLLISIGLFVLLVYLSLILRRTAHTAIMLIDAAEAAQTGLAIFDPRGKLEFTNSRARSYIPMLGRKTTANLTLGQFLDFLYDNAEFFDEKLQNAITQPGTDYGSLSFREFIRLDNGNICVANMRKAKGQRTLFLLNDISRNKNREERILSLYEFNHQLIQAIEVSTCGIVVSDPKQHGNPIIFVNDALCHTFHRGRALLLKEKLSEILSMLDFHGHENCDTLLHNRHNIEVEASLEHEGRTRWFNLQFTPVEDGMDNLDLCICVFTETTELKQREAALSQSQKLEALGKLAAGIAHDFNNILSIIEGYGQMTSNMLDINSEKAREYLNKIGLASKRGAGLTQKMLTFSRHKIVSQKIIDLREVLQEQSILLQPLIEATIKTTFNIPADGDLHIKGTTEGITQILMNLCINARDSMPAGGLLNIDVSHHTPSDLASSISAKMAGSQIVCISVKDTGTGMDASTVARMFDPFFTTKSQGKGSGLGLSVVYGLVQEMGGAIDVKSKPGEGTQINLYFPLSKEKTLTTPKAHAWEHIKSLEGCTIMVAEDEPDLLLLMSRMLQDFGMNVIKACNGEQAMNLQRKYRGDIDILLTDVVMPDMNGVKLAQAMVDVRPKIKIVYMSGYPERGDMAPVILPENVCFAAKPVDYDMLAHLLADVVNSNSNEVCLPQWKQS